MPTLTNVPWVSRNCPSSHGLTAKTVKLTEIGYCEKWSVISNKLRCALMVSGQDHTIFFLSSTYNYIRARAYRTHQNRPRSWAWDWTGDHCVMAEASTDILVDEDGTHVSNCCVKICKCFAIVRIIPSHIPSHDFSFWKLASLSRVVTTITTVLKRIWPHVADFYNCACVVWIHRNGDLMQHDH